ncbi:MAG: sialate O-acetylesterase [Bacteroidaceae bacterium]|nr:sialate O-acetylesterase [Bacteroidaceae bacterium]
MKKSISIFLALALCVTVCFAEVRMPQIFQSGMVLQRGKTIPVWGLADPHETITVSLNKNKCSTTADNSGHWRVDLPAMKAGGPYTLEVRSNTEDGRGKDNQQCSITDVMVGDVWLCSGQSNMETTLERVSPQYPEEFDDLNIMVRLFHVPYQTDTHQPSVDLRPAQWKRLNRQNAWKFSAIGYFLGKHLQRETGVAQGIIESAWGGTPIEAWISADTISRHYPVLYRQMQLYQNEEFVKAQQRAASLANRRWEDVLDGNDPGLGQYARLNFDDSGWPVVSQYNLMPNRREWIGSLWLRQHIQIGKEHAGKAAQLLLGTLYDRDITYINGVQVGSTGYQYPPRRYQVPEGLLHEGDNVIAVRFINKSGVPYFYREKPYRLVFGKDDVLPLGEHWKLQRGAEMPRSIGSGISLQNQPSTLFNGMISPMAPFAVAGVLWYQGESSTGDWAAANYADMLRLLMANWRQAFERPDLPFVIIQLANYMEPSEQPQHTGWSVVREAQRIVAKEDAYAELAVTIDRGETVDIHPLRKKDVAERVALAFDRMLWNPRITLSPEIVNAKAENGTVVCTLSEPLQNEGSLYEFEVAGSDGSYVNAVAEGRGKQIVIKSSVVNPISIRYAWKNNPIRANVYGKNGLPMSPFQMKVE